MANVPYTIIQKLSIHQHINYSMKESSYRSVRKKTLEYPNVYVWGRGLEKIGHEKRLMTQSNTHVWIGGAGVKLFSTLDKVALKLVFGGNCEAME